MAGSIRLEGVQLPAEGHGIRVVADGKPVAIFLHHGKFVAVGAVCTHVGGPLDRGRLTENAVVCPLHGSQFALETGAVLRGPAQQPVAAYRVSVDGSVVVLDPIG